MVTITGLQQTYKYVLQVCNKNQIADRASWVYIHIKGYLYKYHKLNSAKVWAYNIICGPR